MLRIRPLPRLLFTTTNYTPQSVFVVTTRMSSSSTSNRPLHFAPTPEEEESILQSEIAAIEEWWKSPRWKGIKRPYNARDVATKRGTLPQSYPSSTMAKKLFSLLNDKAGKGHPVHTSMPPPPLGISLSAVLMAVTLCSGGYRILTVPNQVQRLFKAQQLHDKRHWDQRLSMTAEEKKKTPYVDYLRPIVADADTGHGGLSAVMKLAKLFAENGAAAIHMEDQMHGGKKCGHLSGKVLVSTGEHINRLIATRFQWDLMGTENLLIARTDSETGKLISSSVDPRDHQFILGVTEDTKPLSETLYELERSGVSGEKIAEVEAEWVAKHKLVTFDEAVVEVLKADFVPEAKINEYLSSAATRSNSNSRALAKELLGRDIFFSWDVPRTREGYYHYKAGMPAAIKRTLAFAPYADMLWLETKKPSLKQAQGFAREIRAPGSPGEGKWLVYNLSPSFNWLNEGFDEAGLKSFVWDMAKEGFVLQLISLAGLHSGAAATCELSRRFKTDGMLAYVDLVQKREKELGCDVLTHQKWSGANYVDGILQSIANSSATSVVGKDSTEHTF
ncbi:isocitrate lyase [Trichophaea hybrida]|nr:isocitrate lyase [Trichophaea hybrida]